MCAELLSDDYVSGTSIKLSTTTSEGISYTVSGKQDTKGDTLNGELTTKFSHCGATITGKLGTNLEPSTELNFKRTIDGVNTNVTLKGGQEIVTGTAEVQLSRAGFYVMGDALNKRGVLSAAVAVAPSRYDWFVVLGAHASLSKGESSVARKMSYAVSMYDGRECEVSAEVEPTSEMGTLSYSHLVRPGLSVAGRVNYSRESGDVLATMGLAKKLDGATTVKAKMDTKGLAGLSYIQEVRPKTKVIMSSAFDVAKFDTAKVGLSVTIE